MGHVWGAFPGSTARSGAPQRVRRTPDGRGPRAPRRRCRVPRSGEPSDRAMAGRGAEDAGATHRDLGRRHAPRGARAARCDLAVGVGPDRRCRRTSSTRVIYSGDARRQGDGRGASGGLPAPRPAPHFASLLIASGADVKVVQHRFRHRARRRRWTPTATCGRTRTSPPAPLSSRCCRASCGLCAD
jgi:hypothetical protein